VVLNFTILWHIKGYYATLKLLSPELGNFDTRLCRISCITTIQGQGKGDDIDRRRRLLYILFRLWYFIARRVHGGPIVITGEASWSGSVLWSSVPANNNGEQGGVDQLRVSILTVIWYLKCLGTALVVSNLQVPY